MSTKSFYLTPVDTDITSLTTVLFKTSTDDAALSQSVLQSSNHANYTPLASVAIDFVDYGAFYKMKIKEMDFDGFDSSTYNSTNADDSGHISFLAGGTSATNIGVTTGSTNDLDLRSYRDANAGTLSSDSSYAYTASAQIGSTADAYAAGSAEYMTDLYMGKVAEDIFTDAQYIKLFDNEASVRGTVNAAVDATSAAFNNLSANDDEFVDAVDLSSDAGSASPAQIMFNLFQSDDDLSARLKTRFDDIAAKVDAGKAADVALGDKIQDDDGNDIGEYAAAASANVVRDVIIYLPLITGDTIIVNSYFNVNDTLANGVQVIADANLGSGADDDAGIARYHKNYYITATATAKD